MADGGLRDDPHYEAALAIFRAGKDGCIAKAIESSPRLTSAVSDLSCRSTAEGWSYPRYLVELNKVISSN